MTTIPATQEVPSAASSAELPLRLNGIHKHFGGVIDIKSFDFEVAAGEIVALVGDNGAGKSTLIKISSGLYRLSEGEIWLSGEKVDLKDASDARAKGGEVVYQDLALVPDQPVYMNMFLGRELTKGSLRSLGRKTMARQTQELVDGREVLIPPTVEQLILKLKERGAAVLIVSHNMDQVFCIADRVSVVRRGTQVGTKRLSETSHNEVVAMITGLSS